MTSHVDAETLALSAEGLLEDTEECAVQQHTADCATCAAQRSELADVTRILAEVPAPPLPDSVSSSLDDALRAEADTRRAEGGGPSSNDSSEGGADGDPALEPPTNVVPMRRRFGSSNRWINYLAIAAAAVVVAGGGTAVVRNLTAEGTVGTPQLAGPDNGAADSSEQGDTALGYQPLVVESGTVYTEDRIDEQAAAVLADSNPMASDGAQGNAESSEGADRPDDAEVPADVSSCIQGLGIGADERPKLIDLAEFAGSGSTGEAWVMYYRSHPDSEARGSYDVVVVSPDCADGGDTDNAVLARTTVTAP